jgi:hypothetical protein
MSQPNHYESDIPCYRVSHDGEKVICITFGIGRTSTIHQILVGDSWEDVTEKLGEQEIILPDDVYVPPEEPEPDID